jgi:formamidopyrimidine-DNA glycosylase
MPELPEVETTLNGIKSFIINQKINSVIIRHYGLRWPIQPDMETVLRGKIITKAYRRGKYLLLATKTGTLILHLGMSGSLCLVNDKIPANKHDHVDIHFANHWCLRFRDPRRFGAMLWTDGDPEEHKLLADLGPEPLAKNFNAAYLMQRAQHKKVNIKALIMDSKIVVGVGNIYANEALFAAGIKPQKPAGKMQLAEAKKLVQAIKTVLKAAIKAGGTTLRDFVHGEGKKGYFKVKLKVYGRGGEACFTCATTLKENRQGQRTTVYCPVCQK